MTRWVLSELFMVLGFILAIVLIAHVLVQKRSPSGTVAWLLVIAVFPVVGVPLYLLLGGRKIRRAAERKSYLPLPEKDLVEPKPVHDADLLLRSHNIPGASSSNTLEFCLTGEQTYHKLVELIEEANESIYICTYVYSKDRAGTDIVERLAKKAREGVDVRLLVDGVGALGVRSFLNRKLRSAGGKWAYFIPVFHQPFKGTANMRNHRKIVVTDRKKVLAGGTNIADEYIGPVPEPRRWVDLAYTIEGTAVSHYCSIFLSDWAFATGQLDPMYDHAAEIKELDDALIQVVPSGPDVPNDALYDSLMTMIYAAEKSFWIITPYFVPDDSLCKALVLAGRRGVDVRIIVPGKSNHPLPDIVRTQYLREIQDAGGQILYYGPNMMHAKAVIVDNELAIVGSPNADVRSLLLDYEVAVFVYSAGHVGQISAWASSVAENCTEAELPRPTFGRDLLEGVARILSPLL